MSKESKDGWIRHRGGECPVEAGTMVDVRYRDGTVGIGLRALRDYSFSTDHHSGWDASKEYWSHDSLSGDIMAWRPHKPSILDEPGEPNDALKEVLELDAPKPIEQRIIEAEQAAIARYAEDPRTMRDLIREIDAEQKAADQAYKEGTDHRAAQRASLVAKLKAEGLALISEPIKAVDSDQVDMGDWRNWRVGDLVEVLNPESSGLGKGAIVKIIEVDFDVGEDEDEATFMPCKLKGANTWLYFRNMKWHSRPTN